MQLADTLARAQVALTDYLNPSLAKQAATGRPLNLPGYADATIARLRILVSEEPLAPITQAPTIQEAWQATLDLLPSAENLRQQNGIVAAYNVKWWTLTREDDETFIPAKKEWMSAQGELGFHLLNAAAIKSGNHLSPRLYWKEAPFQVINDRVLARNIASLDTSRRPRYLRRENTHYEGDVFASATVVYLIQDSGLDTLTVTKFPPGVSRLRSFDDPVAAVNAYVEHLETKNLPRHKLNHEGDVSVLYLADGAKARAVKSYIATRRLLHEAAEIISRNESDLLYEHHRPLPIEHIGVYTVSDRSVHDVPPPLRSPVLAPHS